VINPNSDLLATIVAATRHIVAERERRCPANELAIKANAARPCGDMFIKALKRSGRLNVIAECKRRSPSAGILREDYEPEKIAASYETNGAAAVSVLTESTFFDGSLDDLRTVRSSIDLPILRKDFIVTSYQLLESVAAGADAVLIIVSALDDHTLSKLLEEVSSLGLAALVEVHDSMELRRAVQAGASIIGVNNRSLRTLSVDRTTSHNLVKESPLGVLMVAESGLRNRCDLLELSAAGYNGFLVGEALIGTTDPGETLGRFLDGTLPKDTRLSSNVSEVGSEQPNDFH